jgi:hypothetical protein
MIKNMRHMRMYEAFPVNPGMNLFCRASGFTKQILSRVFGDFCLMLPHMPHVFYSVWTGYLKNMRHMRMYEDRVFKGFYLFRIGIERRALKNMRIGSQKYEAHPHVFAQPGGIMSVRAWKHALLDTLLFWLLVGLVGWGIWMVVR